MLCVSGFELYSRWVPLIIANIFDNFVRRGNSEAEKGGNKTRFNRAY